MVESLWTAEPVFCGAWLILRVRSPCYGCWNFTQSVGCSSVCYYLSGNFIESCVCGICRFSQFFFFSFGLWLIPLRVIKYFFLNAPSEWTKWIMQAKSLQSCLTLCDLMDCSPSGSSVHGILQARILEWVAVSSSRGSSWPGDWTRVPCGSWIAGEFFTAEPLGKPKWIT